MLPTETDLMLIGRLLIAGLLSALIGLEREASQKRAGLRTHILVALGAAAFTEASIYGFGDSVNEPSRVAANIVVGVGFLGAGTIFRSGNTVFGLTTAASLWVVAAIGLLAGTGLGWLALFTTLLVWIVLRFLRLVEQQKFPSFLRWMVGQQPDGQPDDDGTTEQ